MKFMIESSSIEVLRSLAGHRANVHHVLLQLHLLRFHLLHRTIQSLDVHHMLLEAHSHCLIVRFSHSTHIIDIIVLLT